MMGPTEHGVDEQSLRVEEIFRSDVSGCFFHMIGLILFHRPNLNQTWASYHLPHMLTVFLFSYILQTSPPDVIFLPSLLQDSVSIILN